MSVVVLSVICLNFIFTSCIISRERKHEEKHVRDRLEADISPLQGKEKIYKKETSFFNETQLIIELIVFVLLHH